MELTVTSQNTLKINSKKGYLLIDPQTSDDAKIIIQTEVDAPDIAQTNENLVIYGPGDYESNGILVKGNKLDGGVSYSIDTEEGRVIFASSQSISKLTDEDDFDAVVIKAITPVEESSLSAISSGLIIVYGDEANIPANVKAHKTSKLNLNKRGELDSNLVFLEKK